MAKRIGVLTAGGDAPGQNVCLKAIVANAIDRGYEVIGIRKGWDGLMRIDPSSPTTQTDHAMVLTKPRVRDIDRVPGSFLHSSRVDPAHVNTRSAPIFLRPSRDTDQLLDLTDHVKRAVDTLKLDALILLGDNFSLDYAARLNREGVPVVGIPKTVHNDVHGSDYSLGFSTALANAVRIVNDFRAMAGSREEIAVIEAVSRSFGLTTMLISVLAGADRLLIPEVPFDPEKLAVLLMEDKRSNPASYAILTMSEAVSLDPDKLSRYLPELSRLASSRALAEATQAEGQGLTPDLIVYDLAQDLGARVGSSSAVVTEILQNLTGQRVLFQSLSYLIRTGQPDGQDLLGALNFARMAVNLVDTGQTGRLVAYRRGDNYVDVPIDTVSEREGNINVAEFYDAVNYRAKADILWAARI